MIDHIGFPVFNYHRAKVFYTIDRAPLGCVEVMEVSPDLTGSGAP